jgi:hypothetical protein
MVAAPVARLALLTHATPAGAAGQQASWIEFPAETFCRAANCKKAGEIPPEELPENLQRELE